MASNIALIIPARMESTRLPGKPLVDIHGKPMIQHVWERAKESGIADIYLAVGNQELVEAAEKFGAKAILTNPNHPSGSDRIFEALEKIDPDKINRKYDYVMGFQGDIPTFNSTHLKGAIELICKSSADILTFIAPLESAQLENPNDVKALVELNPATTNHGRALYFTRYLSSKSPIKAYYHIGLYLYKREALKRFVAAKPSLYEQNEKLEQLRALALGMHIEALLINEVPLGVDTPKDLEKARRILQPNKNKIKTIKE